MKRLILPIFLLSLILVQSCNHTITNAGDQSLPRKLTETEREIVKADNDFSYDIFRETVAWDTTSDNVFISPLSISMALGMTVNGAAGTTREEMKQALRKNHMSMPEINESYESLIALLTSMDPSVMVNIANSVWIQDGFPVHVEFIETCKTYFEARVDSLDFSDPNAADVINNWVYENTNSLIEEIVAKPIDPFKVMFLINALYFKGDWRTPFNPDDTREERFHLEDGTTAMVDMMQERFEVAALWKKNFEMVDLAYGDSLFSMTLIKPKNGVNVDDFIRESLTADNLARWTDSLETHRITVMMPKFTLAYEIRYNDILKAMGMPQAFSNTADFSNMTGDVVSISEVKHKAFVEVNEEGTEAGAVTSVGIEIISFSGIVFDSPFVFIIRERTTGAILFMGKYANPNE